MRRLIKWLYARLFDAPLPEPLPGDQEAADRLRADLNALPAPPGDGRLWNDNRHRLRAQVANEDPRGFLRWDVVARAMVVSPQLYILRELWPLLLDWPQWRPFVEDPPRGHPWPFPLLPRTSANTIHQAYHLHRFEKATGQRLEEMEQIVEVGGGYGGLCRLVHRRGFRGRYIILDLPEFAALQRYYLEALGVAVVHNQEATPDLKTALVANWSLSEMTLVDREAVLAGCPALSAALIAYQETFDDIDNVAFFREWSERSGLSCEGSAIEHLPHHHYLFGSKLR